MITEEWILAKSREMLLAIWPIKKIHIATHPLGPRKGFVLTASDEFGSVYCTLEDYCGRETLGQDQFALYYLDPCVKQMKTQLEYNKEQMLTSERT